MAKLAIVATIKIPPGRRDEYLKHLRAHAERCRVNEPGTLQFDIVTPHDDANVAMLYEVYASSEAFSGPLARRVHEAIAPRLRRNRSQSVRCAR